MQTILTIILVSGMAIISFIRIFAAENNKAMIVSIIILLLYCFIGFFLIRHSIQESRKEEILRKKVREKTEQLKKSRDDLEEQALEFQKSRDVLQSRAAELESWYNMIVQRELEMRNMKKQIKKLQNGDIKPPQLS
jgi:biopolymer transport protein ExbB/TolQ